MTVRPLVSGVECDGELPRSLLPGFSGVNPLSSCGIVMLDSSAPSAGRTAHRRHIGRAGCVVARAERGAEALDGLTAQTVAAALAKKTGVVSLGSPTDDTDDCSGGDGTGCRRLVTADTVSIYEFDTPAVGALRGIVDTGRP